MDKRGGGVVGGETKRGMFLAKKQHKMN